jgi:hypothetical protein
MARLRELNKKILDRNIQEHEIENGLAALNDPITNFAFCRGILILYCQFLWDERTADNEKKWIDRDEKGDPVFAGNESLFLVDLRGGTFVVNPERRRHYFRARMDLFHVLLDFAHRKRRDILKPAFSKLKVAQDHAI